MPNLSQISDEVMEKIVQHIITLYLKNMDEKDLMNFIESNEKESLQDITNDHLQAKLIAEKAF